MEVSPQEGKAAHLQMSSQVNVETKRGIYPKEQGDKEEGKLESSFCPKLSKIVPARVNSRAHALKLDQPQSADQAGWKGFMKLA